jgi:hypothetical protein
MKSRPVFFVICPACAATPAIAALSRRVLRLASRGSLLPLVAT